MSETPTIAAPPRRARSKLIGAIADYAGLVAFLIGWIVTRNLVSATWFLVAGSAIGLAVAFVAERRIAPMPALAGGAALIFGGLTLIFNDPIFLKMKPTIMNLAFSAALFIGLIVKRSPLKLLLGSAVDLPDAAWRTLTWRYAFFFIFVALLNEAVWRTQPDAIWVYFRFPGLLILTVLFSAAQVPLFMRHAPRDEAPDND